MTAVEEYKRHRSDMKVANMVSGTRTEYLADAALAELEAENEALKTAIGTRVGAVQPDGWLLKVSLVRRKETAVSIAEGGK